MDDKTRKHMLEVSQNIGEADKKSSCGAYETGRLINCEKHGEYPEREMILFSKKISVSHCPKCTKEKEEAEAEELRQLREKSNQERYAKMQENAGVSPRSAKVRFKDFETDTPEKKHVHDSVRNMAKGVHEGKEVPNIILTGKVGTGKTMIGNCAINSLFKLKRVKIIKLQDMLRKIKASYQPGANYTEEEAIKNYSSYDLLIIDEVGVSRETDNDKILIFDVLDGRYQRMLPTMIISNLNIDGIKQTLGDRVVDRLRDGGGILLGCDWDSYRK
ncbi:MAG: ATP-binding protein [Pseudomonadota bacterium]